MATSRLLTFLCFLGLPTILSCPALAQSKAFSGFGAEIDGYIKQSSEYYQIDEAMLRGLVKIEDGWYGKTSHTGATGIGQFTVGTWNWLANTIEGAKIGMSPITSANKNTRLDPRHNQKINMLATALYARWHKEQFIRRGIQINDENLYMAHNIGLDGLYRAMSNKSTAEDLKNMRRNGMQKWMSVSDFIAYQKNRYTQNKLAANFINQSSYTLTAKNINWVEPNETAVRWISPVTVTSTNTNDRIHWIEPIN